MILSKQFKMQYIDLSKFILDPNLIKEIGKKTVADLYFVPLKKIAGKLIVAIADPTDEEKLTKIKEAIQDEIVFVVSSTSSINKLLVNLVYEVKAEIEREEKAKIQAEENEEKISPQTPPATASTLKKEIFTRESVLEGGDIFEAVLNKLEKLKIPLTLAIIQALLVASQEELFAVPLSNVIETVRIVEEDIYTIEGKSVLKLRDEILPLVNMADVFKIEKVLEPDKYLYVVILGLGATKIGLIVDSFIGQEEIVIKSLGEFLKGIPGIAGATIRGDGRVTLILDVGSLMKLAKETHNRVNATAAIGESKKKKEKPEDYVVMIIDDSPMDRKIMKQSLEPLGVQVIEAKDGMEALEKLKKNDIDAMLIDIEMPRMDGYTLAQEIRKYNKYRKLPLIAVTSRTTKSDRVRGVEVGMNEYITKPYTPEYLQNVVRRNLGL
jgi:CheY-like chemotaxis protein/chemotaxis signal transduction protein